MDGFRGMCKINVSIPASGPSLITLQNFPTQNNLKKVLKEGFELGVNRECSMCINSEGACGYNQSSSGFVCYCIDGRHNHTCGSSNEGKIACLHVLVSQPFDWIIYETAQSHHENLEFQVFFLFLCDSKIEFVFSIF